LFTAMTLQMRTGYAAIGAALIGLLLSSCGELGGVVRNKVTTHGGGQTVWLGVRRPNPTDVVVPPGYRIEVAATGLTYPTGIVFDDQNRVYVVEAGYAYVDHYATPRIVRIEPDGHHVVVVSGERRHSPWTGADFYRGGFIVSEGGNPGRVSRVSMDGRITPIVDGLPSKGDHHTDRPVVGHDGWVYFGEGALTNSAVVGEDNEIFAWLHAHPEMHDIPARDIVLTGENFNSQDPRIPLPIARENTGAFKPFGHSSQVGEVIKGQLPATASIMRVRPEGGPLQLVAWGIRNPFGLTLAPDGQLYAVEHGYDARGSRPIDKATDNLFRIERGRWYGFPDYSGDRPVTDPHFKPKDGPQPKFVMAKHPGIPPHPIARFKPHAAAMGLDIGRPGFGGSGEAYVALFGDATPATGVVDAPVGYKVVRIDLGSGAVRDFLTNRGVGPASKIGGHGLERPIDVKFDRTGQVMYVLDFGVMTMPAVPSPKPRTGVLWRITKA
jgi:glucose/arabinose dehydrogenase